jgi:hypothetical protein
MRKLPTFKIRGPRGGVKAATSSKREDSARMTVLNLRTASVDKGKKGVIGERAGSAGNGRLFLS